MAFSKNLTQLIKNNKLSSKEIAIDLEIEENILQSWLTDVSEPSASQLKKIAAYFKVSTDFLLGLGDQSITPIPPSTSPAAFLDFVGQEEKDVDEELMNELIELNKAIDLKRKR